MTMKPLFILVLSLISLLFSPPHISAAATASPAVLDIKGQPLIVGSNYFVLPVIRGSGGGLYPSNTKPNTFGCPVDIIQEASEVQKGIPVVFTPVNSTAKSGGGGGTIPLSTDLNVRFYTPTICARKMGWKMDGLDDSSKQYFVKTGGAEGNPGPQTLSSWFKIEKAAGSDYKFVFCPTVCSFCKVICKDVGIFGQKNGVRFLVLSDVPFKVMFEKTF